MIDQKKYSILLKCIYRKAYPSSKRKTIEKWAGIVGKSAESSISKVDLGVSQITS